MLRVVERCPLCSSPAAEGAVIHRVQQVFWSVDAVRCPVCACCYKRERLDDPWLARLYGSGYEHFLVGGDVASASREHSDRVRRMGQRTGRHLDYGCGSGSFVLAALRAGWDSIGCDPHLPTASTDEALRGRLHRAGAEHLGGFGPFDQITMWATVEHMPELLPTFRSLSSSLAPGGRLLFNCPNADSLIARKHFGSWKLALLAEHLVFLTPASIRWLAGELGLEIAGVRYCGSPYPLALASPGAEGQGLPPGFVPAVDCSLRLEGAVAERSDSGPRSLVRAAVGRCVRNQAVARVLRALVHATRIGDHLEVVLQKR
jgi:2-polyprenyl-3-methyl-5-hydroxy-6-metoxy-1,4-benzoquinol methylase